MEPGVCASGTGPLVHGKHIAPDPPAAVPTFALMQDALGSLLDNPNDPSSPASLADRLDGALPLDAISTALSQLQAADTVRSNIAGLELQAAAEGLLAAKQALSASEAQLAAVAAAAQAYMDAYYPSGGASAPDWAGLVAGMQAAAAAVGTEVGQAPSDVSWADQVRCCLAIRCAGAWHALQ